MSMECKKDKIKNFKSLLSTQLRVFNSGISLWPEKIQKVLLNSALSTQTLFI